MSSTHLVSLRGVRKQFATVTAVDDITLDIPAGGVFALLGPNGAGKSTLLRMPALSASPARPSRSQLCSSA